MIDASGKSDYSKTVSAVVRPGESFIVEAYPNPVKDKLAVKTSGRKGGNAIIILMDVTGKVLKKVNASSNAVTEIEMNGITPGVYIIRYEDDEHNVLIKVNK